MPTPAEDRVQLLVAGQMHDAWESYEVDSDLIIPSDAWRVSLGLHDGVLPAGVVAGAVAELSIGNDRVMTGRIDEITEPISKREHTVTLCGRDGAAALVDCSAPIFVARKAGLPEIVAKVVKPLGITRIRIDADATQTREKVNVEPGDTAWDVLAHAAEANGLWPWFEPDGTLVVGGPDYTTPPVATLVVRRSGRGNNVEKFAQESSIHHRYSEVTVLGQTHGTDTETAKNNLRATAKDPSVAWYRPKVVVDHEADSTAICRDRARKLLADSRLEGYTLTATVRGHRILAPGLLSHGKLWQPGQRIHVIDEIHGIDAPMFLMGRKFTGGRSTGALTELRLKEDNVWVLDAHPHKRKHRRGRNDAIMQDYSGPSS